ncbi:T9SS type A sorting domain-containing protein [bacterium]|nr:T9SS type A sorting domain-containing protein [bacterium]
MKKAVLVMLFVFVLVNFVWAFDPADYFPLVVGYNWTYQDSSMDGIENSSSSVIGTTTMDDYLTYIFVDESSYGSDTTYFQFRSDGLYRYENFMDDATLTLMLMVPNPFNVGDDWEILTFDTCRDEGTHILCQYMELTGYAVSFENVTVPAGYFSGVLKWKMEVYYEVSAIMGGDTVYHEEGHMGDHIIWVAEGIGPIKHYDSEIEEGDTSVFTSVLVSYDFSGIDEQDKILPDAVSLNVFPNPFNSSCRISAPRGTPIDIFDVNGKLITSVKNDLNGDYLWEPEANVGSGVYLVKAEKKGNPIVEKIIYLK